MLENLIERIPVQIVLTASSSLAQFVSQHTGNIGCSHLGHIEFRRGFVAVRRWGDQRCRSRDDIVGLCVVQLSRSADSACDQPPSVLRDRSAGDRMWR